jgi:hypothetical protein
VPVMNVTKFERFFRLAGGLDVDKTDLKRYSDFVHRKSSIRISKIPRRSTGRPPLGCSICCCESASQSPKAID